LEYLRTLYPGETIVVQTTTTNFTDDYETKMKELVAAEFNYDFFLDATLSATGGVQTNASLVVTGSFRDFVGHETELGYHLVFTNPDASIVTIDKWYPLAQFDGYELLIKRVVMEYTHNGSRSIQESYEKGGSSALLNIYLRDIDVPISGTFPSLTLKRDNIYLNDDRFSGGPWKKSVAYQTSKQYAKRLGVNIDTILKLVRDNAQEADIDYCFIQPGLRINSPNQPALEYLFRYFYRIFLLFPDNKPAWDNWVAAADYAAHGPVKKNLAEGSPSQSIHIYDPDYQATTLDMEIGWRWISYEEKSGTIPKYEREVGPQTSVVARYGGFSLSVEDCDTTMFYIRKPLTSSTYAEIAICGLRHENYVYKGHSVQSGVWASINDPNGHDGTGFIIPLDYPIFITLSPRERLQLAQESIHIVFNCYVVRKQKWYEIGIFKIVLFIISVVIIVLSVGTLTPYVTGLYTGVLAGLATIGIVGTLGVALAIFITALVLVSVTATIQYLAKEAGDWAAEKWGPEWGAITQIITVVALSWGAGAIGVGPGFGFTPAQLTDTVLLVGSQVLSTMAAYTDYTYGALNDEIKTWQDYANVTDNPLKKVDDLMEEMFPELTQIQQAATMPKPETLDEFLGRSLTTTDALTGKLFLPIYDMADLTLTPRL
jgi:hypothetical protein